MDNETTGIDVFILSGESRTRGDRTEVVLYGASNVGVIELVCPFKPYFFYEIERTDSATSRYKSLSGKPVTRAEFLNQAASDQQRARLRGEGIRTFESDIRARDRLLMDTFIKGWVRVRGSYERSKGMRCFVNPALEAYDSKAAPKSPTLTCCSLDIETSIETSTILCIGAHVTGGSATENRVFMKGNGVANPETGLSFHDTERQMLLDFLSWFTEADPDLIIGWNVIGFDLSFLAARAKALGLDLTLGRGGRGFSIAERSGRFSRATVPGRVVLDGPQLLRSSFYTFESYSLENISQKVLGEGKLIEPVENRALEIERLYRENTAMLAEYNLKDCILVSEIFKTLGLIDLTVRRSMLSGLLLDQVGYSTAAFEHLLLPRLHQHGFVAPDLEDIQADAASAGGYVFTPKAGLYSDVLHLDFRSLYPTIIRTFFIDPLSLACNTENPVQTPSGHTFSKSTHILSAFIAELMAARAEARKSNDAALSQAIKILMNSFYGVMGSTGCRLYNKALADAITGTGQWLLQESKIWLETCGHEVLYGDTDSLFLRPATTTLSLSAQGADIANRLTEYWRERLELEYGVESQLFVEFKKHYLRFLLPVARGSLEGAKKRYAGLVAKENGTELEFIGLEAVRSDWTPLAREFQRELYARVFEGQSIGIWLREYLERIRTGHYDDKLTYQKRLHRDPNEYSESAPPYVRAARLLGKRVRQVRYVMTIAGPVPVELNPRNPDYIHYIDRQIKPIANAMLETIGSSFDEKVKPVQLCLL